MTRPWRGPPPCGRACRKALEAILAGEPPQPVAEAAAAAAVETWRAAGAALAEAERRRDEILPRERQLAEARITSRHETAQAAKAELERAEAELESKQKVAGMFTEQQLREVKAARDGARSRLAAAQAGVVEEQHRLSLVEAEAVEKLANAQASLESAQARLVDEAARVAGLHQEAVADGRALQVERGVVERTLERLTIRAPVDGLVVLAEPIAAGDRIEPRQAICSIAATSVVSAEADFRNRDAGKLRAGAPCKVKLDAFPFEEYGVVAGRLESIAIAPTTDEDSGESFYSADIALERLSVRGASGEKIPLTPGLNLTVEVVTDRPRLITLLFEPLRRLESDLSTGDGEASPEDGPSVAPEERVEPPASFDAPRAFTDLEAIVAGGARPLGSEPLERARVHVNRELEAAGLAPVREPAEVDTPLGPRAIESVVAHVPPLSASGEEPTPRVLLLAHLDTRRLESEPYFVGANDGASGAAVLLEVARAVAAAPEKTFGAISFVFTDGHEPVGREGGRDGLYGSRELARRLVAEGRARDVLAVIAVDMVGDRDLAFTAETSSTRWVADLIAREGARVGHGERFERGRAGVIPLPIAHDHVPFVEAGMPAALLADWDFGGPDPIRRMARNQWRFTALDRPEHCDAKSLGVTGEVLLQSLRALRQRQ